VIPLKEKSSNLALNDFPRSNSQIEYGYLITPIIQALLRDCVKLSPTETFASVEDSVSVIHKD